MKLIDLQGTIFGRWTVEKKAPRSAYGQTMWVCVCTCGVRKSVNAQYLRSGKSTSCGCFRTENRPKLCKNRDFTGQKNPRAKVSKSKTKEWVPSHTVEYRRAAGIFYSAKRNNVPVGFPSVAALAEYVVRITPKECPVFGVPFQGRGSGFSKWSPSIDKIDPTLGYVPGNIQVISMLANCMKRDATRQQLEQFAAWILEN